MKNLLDDLHKLNDEDFEVSKDFSKKVMSKINKDKKITILKRATSVVAVACVLGVVIMVSNKLGLKERITNTASRKENVVQSMQATDSEPEIVVQSKQATGSEIDNTSIVKETVLYDNYETEQASANIESNEIINEAPVLYENAEEGMSLRKTYSKQMNLEDYINEIHKKLDDNKIENKIISDTQIEIYNSDVNTIYDLLEIYVDINLELNDEKIILTVK